MVTIPELWLPILLSAVVVTAAAAVFWALLPGPEPVRGFGTPMVRSLGMMLCYALAVGIFVAYLTGRTVDPGAAYKEVYRVAATSGFLAYAGGQFLGAVRATRSWVVAGWDFAHGAVFGLLTGGPFGWLWPQ
jgi:hypothetical protein